MKLRPRDPSSSRGKSKYVESSSNDDGSGVEIPSDSDYKSPSEREGEDLSNILGDGVGTALEFNADDDNLYNVYQSEGPSKTAGDVLEDQNADVETLAYDNAMDSDLEGVLEQKPIIKKKGRKKKKPTLMWEVWKQEDERWIAENLGADSTLTDEPEMVHETEEPSEDLIIPLLRYQKEWLAWALKQEKSRVRGGILADEMGMGKTLQAIALVLLKRTMQKEMNEHALHSSELPSVKGTLVVCPLAAVLEWVHEIELFTFEGSTKVLVYHGAKRENYRSKLSDYDFVITSYSVVEAEYRKQAMPPKKKCQYCGKLFQHNKLETHLKSKCGPDAVKTAKQSKKGAKEPTSKEMAGSETRESILHSVMWNRIILDEAHYIKSRNSKTSKAVFALKSSYKWALSGTPIQNRFEELHSLVRFLQVRPYAYYFCRNCDCRKLVHRVEKCSECGHNSYDHFCWWKKFIAWAIENPQTREGAFLLLRQKILKSLLLRRTKKGRAADLAIPPRIVTVRRDSLDVVEEDYYRALYTDSVQQFQKYVAAGTVLSNYCHILDLLTRLRQAVDHPYLIEYSLTNRKIAGLRADYSNGENCSICHAEEDTVVTSCGHIFCKPCLIEYALGLEQNTCPTCSKPLTVDFSSKKVDDKQGSETTVKGFKSSSILNRIDLDHFQTSTKIDALMEEIRFMVEKDGSAKGIVFSQFVTFLDLIHYALLKSRVNCVQLDGSMTMEARGAAVKKFTEDPHCRIFLMSLKAGGVALNLTVASHVFLMDPWWNPATERQAQDRIHRIGQLKPIRIVRFIIENTIEERILKLQEKKELVFEGTFGGAKDVLTKLDSDDISYLFGL